MSMVSSRVCTQNKHQHTATAASEGARIRNGDQQGAITRQWTTSYENSSELDNQKRQIRLERLRAFVDETCYVGPTNVLPSLTYRSRIKVRKRPSERQVMCGGQEKPRLAAGRSFALREGRRRRASVPADERPTVLVNLRRTRSSGEEAVTQETKESCAPGPEEDAVFQPTSVCCAQASGWPARAVQWPQDTREAPRRSRVGNGESPDKLGCSISPEIQQRQD